MKNRFDKNKVYRKGLAETVESVDVTKYKPFAKKGHKTNVIKHKNFSLDNYPEDKEVYRFCISSQEIDRDGDIVIQSGIKYDDYINNPVVFWGHEWDSVPIGKVVAVTYDETELKTYADVILGSTTRAQEIETLVKEGIIQATSIGFRIKDWDYDEELDAFVMKETELLELSLVGLPANPDAVGVETVEGKDLEEDEETKSFEEKSVTLEQVQEIVAQAVAAALDDKPEEIEEVEEDPVPVPEDEDGKEEDVDEANDKEDNKSKEEATPNGQAATIEQLAAMEERLLEALRNINGEDGDGDDSEDVDPEPEDKSEEDSGSNESDEDEETDDDNTPVIILSE